MRCGSQARHLRLGFNSLIREHSVFLYTSIREPQHLTITMLCLRCTRRIALAPSSLSSSSKPMTSLLQSTIRTNASRPAAPQAQRYQHLSLHLEPQEKKQTNTITQTRTFASFSNIRSTFQSLKRPTLPSTPSTSLSLSTILETPSASALLPASVSAPGNLLQSRGPKRDTFDPSHFVRKRRHGFLSRVRTRNGRNLLKRRRSKRRSTLAH